MRILHVLHSSLPLVAGYSIRTDYILRSLKKMGIDSAVATSTQQPGATAAVEVVDGVPCYRTVPLEGAPPPFLREGRMMSALYTTVDRAIQEVRPDVVHAASPVLVGIPALAAARRHRLPLVYEVRDLWENASVDRGRFAPTSARYRLTRQLETTLCRGADAVVTICRSLGDELAPRCGETPLFVQPNGVDLGRFTPSPPQDASRGRWGVRGKRVITYLGAFQPYEGIDLLIGAMPRILSEVPDARLLVVGAGGVEEALKAQAEALALGDRILFTGRIQHELVQEIYALSDVLVYPRAHTRTTALTTPLKPLEAMAMARPVIVSDVPALLELVTPDETGVVFRHGDAASLTGAIVRVLRDGELRRALGERARRWVERERGWDRIVTDYRRIYEVATERSARRWSLSAAALHADPQREGGGSHAA